jgi:hypothetical protein
MLAAEHPSALAMASILIPVINSVVAFLKSIVLSAIDNAALYSYIAYTIKV